MDWLRLHAALAFLFAIVLGTISCDQAPSVVASEEKSESADKAAAVETSVEPVSAEPSKPHGEKNHLAGETSPYLLMHVHNPVDWYPWGEAAFAKAKRENKLIFLSIGYSSCYWCHVMERESFKDPNVAAVLNKNFVCIKVDREERPDVDQIYMTALQIRTRQSGGWPMSMFLAPDAKPFFGGTYFPKASFLQVLGDIHQKWDKAPADFLKDAEVLSRLVRLELQHNIQLKADTSLRSSMIDGVQKALARLFDPQWGGFGYSETNSRRPKFPSTPDLLYLVHRAREGNEDARRMLLLTLDKMAQGGIFDHLGGGFHRYRVDRFWRIPHFEKMLYDNAQLASVYAEAHELTGREDFARVTRSVLDFVLREMTDAEGGFYSAIDAETDEEEGKYYRWNVEEAREALGNEPFELFASTYGFDGPANFEGKFFVPVLKQTLAKEAKGREMSEAQLEAKLLPLRQRLLEVRSKRERPLTDTKILTAWNGLMIRGFADAGRILKEERYLNSATKAADFVLAKLKTEEGRLLRTYRNETAKLNGYLDDYAFLVDGLIALHRATGEPRWLQAADELTAKQIELFWDEESGGFFYTSTDHETLIARAKNPTDSVRPSGNAVTAGNLVYLGRELKKPEYLRRGRKTIESLASYLVSSSSAGSVPRTAVALFDLLKAEKQGKQEKQ